MRKKILLFFCFACIFLSSCGRSASFESGSITTDAGIISNGVFAATTVKSDFAMDGFSCTDAAYISDKFYYSFIQYSMTDMRLISFDSKGENFSDVVLQLPFSSDNYAISSNSYSSTIDLDDIDGLTIYYYNPFFTDNSVSGYCSFNGIIFSEDSPTAFISRYYLINWNFDGTIESVEAVDIPDENKESLLYPQFNSIDNAGHLLTLTDSGIVRSDNDGKYSDTYFDFINSSFITSLDKIVYANEDLFSAITYDINGSMNLSVFNKSGGNLNGVTPISLYCTSLSDDLRNQIQNFNNSSKEYRIGIKNYSDIYRDYSEQYFDADSLNDIALYMMEEDVLSGDVPDLIYEAGGLDKIFVNSLSSGNTIVDLRESIKNDSSLKGNSYLTNIYDLHKKDSIYAVIPSFTFDTYVTSVLNTDISRNWTLDEFLNYKSLVLGDTVIMDSYTSYDFIYQALAFNGDCWIDSSNGDATFGADYKSYLETALHLPGSYDEFVEFGMTGQIPVNIHLFYTPIGNLSADYLVSWKRVASQPVNVGFPTNTGSDRVIHPTGALMMCSDRVAAQGCWDFIKSFLTKEYQDSLDNSIPVLQSSYENWKTNTSYEGYSETDLVMMIDDQLYTAPQLGTDKVDLLSNMILSNDKYYFDNPAIQEIVLRNASNYFEGTVSVDEAAANTEREVEAYLKTVLNNG